MGETLSGLRFLGLVLLMLLAVGGPAVGQTPTQETVAFVADLERVPPCCHIPMELAALLAVAELPGIIRVVMDETAGLLVVMTLGVVYFGWLVGTKPGESRSVSP